MSTREIWVIGAARTAVGTFGGALKDVALADLATTALRGVLERSGVAADRFEAETEAFFTRVREGYLEVARREPHRVKVVNAALELQAVQAQVVSVLEGLV